VALTPDTWLVDEDVFFTASTRRSAERLIKSSSVEPGSWWRVTSARLDDVEGTRAEDRTRTVYYLRSGKAISSPPRLRGYRAAIRREKRNAEIIEKRLTTADRDGTSKRVIRNLRNSLLSIRRILSRHP